MKKLLILLGLCAGLSYSLEIKGEIAANAGLNTFFVDAGDHRFVSHRGTAGINADFKIEIPKKVITSDKFKLYATGGLSQEVIFGKGKKHVLGRTKVTSGLELEYKYTNFLKPYVGVKAGIGAIYKKGVKLTGGAELEGGLKYNNIKGALFLGLDGIGEINSDAIYMGTNSGVTSLKVGAKFGYEFDIYKK